MKNGLKTSEFHLTVMTTIFAFAAAIYGLDAGVIAACTGPCAVYIGGRSYVKK